MDEQTPPEFGEAVAEFRRIAQETRDPELATKLNAYLDLLEHRNHLPDCPYLNGGGCRCWRSHPALCSEPEESR